MRKHRWGMGLAIVLSGLFLWYCTDPVQPEREAEELTLQQLRSTPGFSWFDLEMSLYHPDSTVIQQIAAAYQPGEHHFTFFVKPECQCQGTTKLFPRIVRILLDASIPDTAMTIYAMQSVNDKHPDPQRFHIKTLPSIFCTRNGNVVGMISELPEHQTLEEIILDWLTK